ncbi:MAG: efflux RND transporter permease subunit [Desulfuromonadaceae bacterium]|nr:efflux RND transporter permease subunit [Desulfuromonadaceae bacterium]
MILSNTSIKRPIFATVMILALVVLGIFSYRRLSVEMFPNVEFPVISVVTTFPGASPETVERELSKRIEDAVNQVAGVKHVFSTSRESVSTVVVQFRLEEKVNDCAQEVRAKISSIRGTLPTGIEEPIIQKLDFNAAPIAALAVQSSTLTPRELTALVEKKIKKRFESVAGVGKVDMVGGQKREINVDLDPVRLDSLGIGVNDIVTGIKSENTNTPLGRITKGQAEYPLRIEGKPERAGQYRQMVVFQKGGRPITLGEVAQVSDGIEEKRKLALVNGQPAIGLDIYKQSGGNQVELVDTVKKVMAKVQQEIPSGVTISLVRDGSIMTRESLADVKETLIIGGILTVLIVFCFINSWRSTVITGVTLPISVISSFIIMNAMGMTLNVMTLMALSLAIGMLIDDAIVVRENIVRHLEMGKDHMEAARFGTSEIGLAVFATSMSIIAVFIPVAFMKGIVGRFFYQFGISVAFAVLVSLFVSFTLDPMLSSRWHDPSIHLQGKRKGIARWLEIFNSWFDRTADRYRGAIAWALDHRKTVMALAVASFVVGIMIFSTLESSFMAPEDKGEFQVAFKTAPDASMTETEGRMKDVISAVTAASEVDHTYATIGAGDSGTVRDGLLYVKLKERNQRKKNQFTLQREARERLQKVAGITFSIEEVGQIGGSQKPLNVNLKGDDLTVLKQLGARLKEELYKVPGIVDLSMTLENDIPEYRMRVDRDKALSVGVTTSDIVGVVSRMVGGEAISTYEDEDGDAVDVRVRLPAGLRQNPTQVQDLKISVPDGSGGNKLIPLSSLTSTVVAASPTEINRRDLARQITISANLDRLPVGTAAKYVEEAAKKINMPPGYSINLSGEAEDMAESFGYMGESLLLAVLFVYLILAAQFESFFEPMAIMLSLPLSIVGMAGMLKLTGDTINIMSLIGLIMLMGLVTKNAILLVDYAKVLQKRDNMGRRDAVIQAGRTRLRPIIMTTLAMIFGMMPLFLGLGAGAEGRAPMARAVVGGLITSTFLTLLVVPVMYTVMDDFGSWLKRKWRGKTVAAVTVLLFAFSVSPCLSGGCSDAQAAEIRTVTLEQAISIAMEKNRDIEKAREYARYVDGKYVEERAAALPQLSLNGYAGMTKDNSQGALYGAGTAPLQYGRNADVSLSQPLYTWGKIGAAIRAAEAGLKTAEDQLRLFQQAAVRDVTTVFCDVLLAKELHTAARENLEQKKRLLDEARRKYAAGTATDYDVLAAEVAVENAFPTTIKSENTITAARHQLSFLLAMDGQEVDADGTLAAQFTDPPDYQQALKSAQSKRPELADLRHRIGIYRELVTIAEAENKPRLDFKGSAGWHWMDIKESPALNGSSNGSAWNAGLYLSFPFFDGFRGSGKTAQAKSDLRSRQIDEARLLESIALEIWTSRDAVKEAADIVQALSGTVRQAERLVQMAEKGYEFGVKIRLELDDAQLNLVQARSNLARAQRDYRVAQVNLLWAMGVAGE